MDAEESTLRAAMTAALKRLDVLGLNRGSTGNLSCRLGEGMLITPTGMDAEALQPDDLVWMSADGTVRGAWQPSSEWAFHHAVYQARPDLSAVVHMHSPQATALACLRQPLPSFHYMVAVAGGPDVPLVPYHTFGTLALSTAVGAAFAQRNACLLANHGLVAAGRDLRHAMKVALEIESLSGMYLQALAVGAPVLLDEVQMAEVIEKFRHYGQTSRR